MKQRSAMRGLTLTEILVAIALLAALAGGALPAVNVLMSRGQRQECEDYMRISWEIARTRALAGQRPVLWEITNGEQGARLTVRSEIDAAPFWSKSIDGFHAKARRQGASVFEDRLSIPVFSHGVTDPVEVELTGSDQTIELTLPAVGGDISQ